MGVIKAPNVPAAAATFSMKDIENAARGMLLRARQQAEALLAEAQRGGEEMRRAAHADGLAEGRAEGLRRGAAEGHEAGRQQAASEHGAELAAAAAALNAAAQELEHSRAEMEADGLRRVIELAVAIARRVTKRQGLIDPGVLAANAAEAMKLVVNAADVRISVHPDQMKTLEDTLPRLRLSLPKLGHVEVVEDASVAPGGCRVSSGGGQIDADLDAQLDRVVADLMPGVGEGES